MKMIPRIVLPVLVVVLCGCPLGNPYAGVATLRVQNEANGASIAGIFTIAPGGVPIATNALATPLRRGQSIDIPLYKQGDWSVQVWLDTTGRTDYLAPLFANQFRGSQFLVWNSGLYGNNQPVHVLGDTVVSLTVTQQNGQLVVNQSSKPRLTAKGN